MAALILPSRRVVQPQGPVGVDWSNPLARGLVSAINPAALRRNQIGVGSILIVSGPAGMELRGNNARFITESTPAFGSAATILAICTWQTDATGNSFPVSLGTNGAGNQLFGLQGSSDGSRARAVIRTVNGGGVTTAESATIGPGFSGEGYLVRAAVYDGTSALKLYISGLDNTLSNANTAASGAMSSMDNFTLGGVNRGTDGFAVTGQNQSLGIAWNRALSPEEIRAVSENPWQLFRPIHRRIIVDMGAGGIAVDLVPADASHAHAADNVALTSLTGLSVNSATHAHFAESVVLTTSTVLTVADASHAQSADNLTLGTTFAVDLAVADASHAHAADSVALVVASVLAVADAAHAHTAESVGLTTVETLTVASADHAHSAENVALTIGGIGLTVSDATHAQAAEAPTLSADSFLIAADATHGHTADLLTLSTSVFFAVDDAVHAQTADNLSLDGAPTLQAAAAQHLQTAETVALTMESWLEAANAAHAHTAQNITLSVVADAEPLTNEEMRELLESVRVLRIQLQAVNGYTSLIPALL